MQIDNQPTDKKEYENPTNGMHPAICYMVVDLGTQTTQFLSEPPKKQRRVLIGWELHSKMMRDGRPFSVVKEYNVNPPVGPKHPITGDLTSWLSGPPPLGFDLKDLLGKSCNLNILNKPTRAGGLFANVKGVMPLMEGQKEPAQVNASLYFDLSAFKQVEFDSIPKWIREKKIMLSPEYLNLGKPVPAAPAARPKPAQAMDDLDDEIPF